MNEQPIPFVKPPAKWKGSKVIEHERGTRQYTERGTTWAFRHWLRELHEALPGDLIPLSWVPEYVGVTRGAVKKRVDTNRLTVFTFVVKEAKETMLGKTVYRETRTKFDYTSMAECDAWREDMYERMNEELEAEERKKNEPRKHKRRK